ncbi:MAG: galactose mutarotase [Candidatus Acidiferrum sp.]
MLASRIGASAFNLAVAIFLCVVAMQAGAMPKIQKQPYGKTSDSQPVDLYILSNTKGLKVAITNYGATIVSLKVPDRKGKIADVVLGYDTLQGYVTDKAYFGATVGRYGNRIANGKFMLNGVAYTLPKNNGPNTLHGGIVGFNKKVWLARDVSSQNVASLELTYVSKDGEEGFPGNLTVTVVFTLPADRNELKTEYRATTDKDTVLNITNHSYFNLAGQGNGDILQHRVTLYASRFTPVDEAMIPTGELRDVKGTPFDFLHATQIGARISQDDEQLKFGKGYDHNWVINKTGDASALSPAGEAFDPQSGRVLEVLTTEPGVQFYTGNFLDGTAKGKGGKGYGIRSAFCLETQHFPDSPNHPAFPTTVLEAGKSYHSTTVFRFSTR